MRFLPSPQTASSVLSATVLAGCGLLALAVVLGGCASSPKVSIDKDPAVDLGSYKTFGYFDKVATDKTPYSTLMTSHLKRATRAQLEQHGYTFVDANPDLRVNFFLNVADKVELHSSPSAGRFGYRAWAGASYDLVEYRQGTLRIDLVDARRNALVWQGRAENRISEQASKNPGAAVDAVVGEIFAHFPAAPAK